MESINVKYFTAEEAKKTLPYVKSIVRDILDCGMLVRGISESHNGKIDGHDEAESLINKINSYLKELEDIGCFYKDWNFTVGLVDFPSVINGEDVLLCWRSDEENIEYYHTVQEGYSGRKKIPEDYLHLN